VPEGSLPKDAKPGCSLSGTLHLAKTSPCAGAKHAPGPCTLIFTVPPSKKDSGKDSEKDGSAGKDEDKEELDAVEILRESRRDADVRALTRCPLLLYSPVLFLVEILG
jgi:hypothetical protein